MNRLNLLNTVLLVFIVIVITGHFFKSQGPSPYPLFQGEHDRVIDPYLQREVKNTIVANARDIQLCFNEYTRLPEAKEGGLLHLDWLIEAQGKVKSARVVHSEFADSQFEACVIKALSAWHFPPPHDLRYAEHRFQFSKTDEH